MKSIWKLCLALSMLLISPALARAESCCDKAAAKGERCAHKCCQAAFANGTQCFKCNADKAKSCCEKAAAAGKACDHPCCVKAAAQGDLCPKCNSHIKDNTPPAGFTALFNGKDLTNWRGLIGDGNPIKNAKLTPEQLAAARKTADESMNKHWKVVDGVIVFDGKGQSLCTVKDYADFECFVDWKIEKAGDSGIYVRSSPQIQIWDTENKGQWGVGSDKGSGALWNNQKSGNRPLVKADKPVGQWNRFFIKMVGENLTVYLNGQLVLDNVVMENYWDRKQPIFKSGSIELQNHGNSLYFKNIYVRELTAAAAK